MPKKRDALFDEFLAIKKRSGLKFYDAHTHPVDVFGIAGAAEEGCACHAKPSLLELLKYNDLSLDILKRLFFYAPAYIRGEIAKKYRGFDEKEILQEMTDAGIDEAAVLPIYPHASPHKIFSQFQSERFLRLGSVDFSLTVPEIEQDLIEQIKRFSIIGIKLHPNIQNFYPNPSANVGDMREKLERVYDIARQHNLHLLFHGGFSFVPEHSKFQAKDYGVLKNFLSDRSFLLSLKVPVVIAHMGIYNVVNPDFGLFDELVKIPNLYFDTAGINPKHVGWFLKKFGSDKIVFGSDMPYFNVRYAVQLILEIIYQVQPENFEKNVISLFNKNYSHIISRP